jgi:hypothetical protein
MLAIKKKPKIIGQVCEATCIILGIRKSAEEDTWTKALFVTKPLAEVSRHPRPRLSPPPEVIQSLNRQLPLRAR